MSCYGLTTTPAPHVPALLRVWGREQVEDLGKGLRHDPGKKGWRGGRKVVLKFCLCFSLSKPILTGNKLN